MNRQRTEAIRNARGQWRLLKDASNELRPTILMSFRVYQLVQNRRRNSIIHHNSIHCNQRVLPQELKQRVPAVLLAKL